METREFANFTFSFDDVIRYRIVGSGPRKVVLLHGFAASLQTWDDLLPFFSADLFTLHLLDLKGHGQSSRPRRGDYSPTHNARLVTAFIRSLSLQSVTVIGHSMGGSVALLAALNCPEIARLILIGAPAYPQPIPRFMNLLRLPVIGPLTMAILPANLIARLGLRAAFHRHERITVRHIARYASCYHGLSAACALASTVRQLVPENFAGLVELYGQVTVPVLLLWGENDQVVPVWQGERLQRELSDAQLVVLKDCGHNPHEERPDETFARIVPFFDAGDVDKRATT